MIRSMTGFGQATLETDLCRVNIEMKSVNHRFLEINVRIPREYLFLEDSLKKKIGETIKRGKIDIFVLFERKEGLAKKVTLDWNLADQYIEIIQELMKRHAIFAKTSPSPLEILALPDVAQIEEATIQDGNISDIVLKTVDSACQQLLHMRKSEGMVLLADLSGRISNINRIVREISSHAPSVSERYRDRLVQRMHELLQGEPDMGRIVSEAALFAEKSNIDEELVRLLSHTQQFELILESEDAVGRKLDFLVQEMNREVNTIGSKANDIEISGRVVDLKAELEKIKEQVQNIE